MEKEKGVGKHEYAIMDCNLATKHFKPYPC